MSNDKYLDNMNIQYSPKEKEDDYEHNDSNESSAIQNNTELKRGIITRFMDSKIDTYNDRISSLKEKNDFSTKKFKEIKVKSINFIQKFQNWKSKISF